MNLSKRNLIIIGTIVVILLVSSFIFAASRKPDAAPVPDEKGYVDPGSGETIKNDKDSNVPEEAKKDYILFAGFSKLIERGLSAGQVQQIQTMLKKYSADNDKKFTEVSLQVDSMRRILPQGTSRTHTLTFNIVANRQDIYFVKAEYSNTSTVKTTLYKADKTTQLFQQ